LESLPDPLAARHKFLYTSANAIGFALHQRFGGEVVDAGVKAVGDEVGEHLRGEGLASSVELCVELCAGEVKMSHQAYCICRIVPKHTRILAITMP